MRQDGCHPNTQNFLILIMHFTQLNITYTALQRQPATCVQFLGISQLRASSDGRVFTSKQSPEVQRQLFLVFRRATEGDLLDFLHCHLKDVNEQSGWLLITSALSNIAAGLAVIHDEGVIHG
jgi:hypothetical protein